MALEPMWQSNYVDLSDEATIRFGVWCTACGARYVSADEVLDPALPVLAPPGSAATRAIEEAKYRVFVEFDAAFREIAIHCYRCERSVCPDCWDEDNSMCGACVKAQGLPRSPHRGVYAAPLTDGRLRCIEPGQYAEVSRPGWLDALVALQPQVSTNGGTPGASDAMWHSASAISPLDPPRQAPEPAPPLQASTAAAAAIAALPTVPIASAPLSPPPPAPPSEFRAVRVQTPAAPTAPAPLPTPTPTPTPAHDYVPQEGKATASMVQCPRCGAANYDFVTRCTVCQLQLIRTCPVCERLNPGHVTICESCGSPLDRPSGSSGMHARAMPLPAEAALLKIANELASFGGRRGSPVQQPRRSSVAGTEPSASGWAQPQAPGMSQMAAGTGGGAAAFAPAAKVQPELAYARSGRGLNTILVVSERIATAVLWLAILVLIGGIVAAELSPRADAVIQSIMHVDVRVSLNTFWSWMQTWWQHVHK
jgi:hypothetical protein